MTVRINKIVEDVCVLFSSDGCIGEIRSELQLYDVRLQIKIQKLKGYYILWKDYIIRIDHRGNLESYPNGFYDKSINLLLQL